MEGDDARGVDVRDAEPRTSTATNWTGLPVAFKESPRMLAVLANVRRSDARLAAGWLLAAPNTSTQPLARRHLS
jgi:hypothetical protein